MRRWCCLSLLWLIACGGSAQWAPARQGTFPRQVGWTTPPPVSGDRAAATACATKPLATRQSCAAGQRLSMSLTQATLDLDAGRWVVLVEAPAERFVSIGLAGPGDALSRFEVLGPRSLRRLRAGTEDDDKRLPTFVSFETTSRPAQITVVVDVTKPVRLLRAAADPTDIAERPARALKLGQVEPRALVGLPFPIERRAGYSLRAPHRYQFVRADVAVALRQALRQTRVRFKRNAIGIGDVSQWDGQRPALDLGRPRHISHTGGRDVDIGLPSSDQSPSELRRRCDGVLVDKDVLECGPGTVRNLDAVRLAYFLGLLIDGPTPGGRHIADADRRPGPTAVVETIFTDQVYIDEIRKGLRVLRRKRWIHDDAFGALGEDGLLRPSPWHVDHVHIRFEGEAALVPKVLQFAAQHPPAKGAESAASRTP